MKIIPGDGGSVNCLNKEEIINYLKDSGILILRNFDMNIEKFSNFIGSISSRVTSDPARKSSAKNAQLIEAGEMKMGLHLENGNAPFMPDLQFFYCGLAPRTMSRTTYCDGVEAYQKLDSAIADELQNRQIMYTRDIDEIKWKKYFSVEMDKPINTLDDVLPHLPEYVQLIRKNDGYIQWRIRRNIVFDSPLSGRRVLAHCIYGPSINYEIVHTTWSDGSMIRPGILDNISKVCDELTKPIQYVKNDIVILDNHRVMHGREAIFDHERKIYGGQGYL